MSSAVPLPFWNTKRAGSLVFILAVFAALFALKQPQFPIHGIGFSPVPDPVEGVEAPVFESEIISKGKVNEVHSPSLVPLANGGVCAFWYGGEREGAQDIAIYASKYDPATGKWSAEYPIIGREATQEGVDRFIKKLGNAVALRDARNRIWMFYVSSMWGWSASAINVIYSDDECSTWSEPRRLVTTPFLNQSTLVRGQPFLFADGTIGLPVYHEFIGKFCELLRLDGNGHIIHKQRLSHGRTSLQPAIVPLSPTHAVCSMRPAGSSGKKVLVSETHDGGRTWTEAEPSKMHSDYSGSAPIGMQNNDLLTITRQEEKLLFYVSDDGGDNWKKTFELDHAETSGRTRRHGPSYPAVYQTPDGDYHLVYSLERKEIRHVRFNQAWMDKQR